MKKLYITGIVLFLGACGNLDTQHAGDPAHSVSSPQNNDLAHGATTASMPMYLGPEVSSGQSQSPINIISGKTLGAHHSILIHYEESREVLKNLGHTVQFNYDEGSYVMVDEQRFDLKQFHFHTPSEHLVDGITYPMEMHMVHALHVTGDKETEPQYLVIGLLFKEGRENPFLAEFIDQLPEKQGQTVELANKHLNVSSLVKDHINSYYHYFGSLTTHPYTEAVNWYVLNHIFEASPEQIEKINKLEGNNARHIQALNNRKVEAEWH